MIPVRQAAAPARVWFQAFPQFFQRKIINVAEVNQRPGLEESGKWLENVDQTHLVLASGKPVQQIKETVGLLTLYGSSGTLILSPKYNKRTILSFSCAKTMFQSRPILYLIKIFTARNLFCSAYFRPSPLTKSLKSTRWVRVDAGIWIRGRWVRSAITTSVPCGPPQHMVFKNWSVYHLLQFVDVMNYPINQY